MGGKWSIPIEEHQTVIELYKSGLSQIKIGKIYNVDRTVISRILKRNGVELRDASHRKRKYSLNENYFDIIDSQNKAYILGLLYADGCNYPPARNVNITLQEKDKDILERIKQEVDSDVPLYCKRLSDKNENHQDVYSLTFTNKHMSDQLEELGLVQHKSLILTFPSWLEEYLYPHFIRGYFDGDGCFCGNSITIASTKQFCEHLQNICLDKLNISTYIKDVFGKENAETKVFCVYGKNKVKCFLDYIYNDADMYIQRKHDSYINKYYQIEA